MGQMGHCGWTCVQSPGEGEESGNTPEACIPLSAADPEPPLEAFGIRCRKAEVSAEGGLLKGGGRPVKLVVRDSGWSVGGMKGNGVCRDAAVRNSTN